MIDFACKRFDVDEIIKCGLGLTKSELTIFYFFVKSQEKDFTSYELSKKLNFNVTTIQKGVKKLADQNIIYRHQTNLSSGGYIFTYSCTPKRNIRIILKGIIKSWSQKVESSIDDW